MDKKYAKLCWFFGGINLHQSIKLFRGGEAQFVISKEASCQRLCVRYSSQYARECLSCMKSIVQILPSCFTHPTSQIKTLGAKKEARPGTIMEQMSLFRSVFPRRCIKMPQSKAEPRQTAALLLNIQSERRPFLITSHRTVSVPGEYRHYVECQLQQIASICIWEKKKPPRK